jgi:hypothetical protein
MAAISGRPLFRNSGDSLRKRARKSYIEDQPSRAGDYSLLFFYWIKGSSCIQTRRSTNFADTHSLVLLVDSLSLMTALETSLDPRLHYADGTPAAARLLALLRASLCFFYPGQSGRRRTLERTLDAFTRPSFLGAQAAATSRLLATRSWGTTWHLEKTCRKPIPRKTSRSSKTKIDELIGFSRRANIRSHPMDAA